MLKSINSEQQQDVTTEPVPGTTTPGPSRFGHQNYLSRIARSEFLLNQLKGEEPQNLANFGIQAEAITNFETIINKVKATNKDQEGAKALLKTLSARVRDELHEMEVMYITLKKKVKAEAPLEIWKKYGFADKQ